MSGVQLSGEEALQILEAAKGQVRDTAPACTTEEEKHGNAAIVLAFDMGMAALRRAPAPHSVLALIKTAAAVVKDGRMATTGAISVPSEKFEDLRQACKAVAGLDT